MRLALVSGLAWTASGGADDPAVWTWIGIVGPALFAAVLLFAVVRALLRDGRYRVVRTFTDADREAVRRAVADAESRTSGEILPVVLERSDRHPGAEWLAALAFALVGSALLVVWLPWDHPTWILAGQVVLGAAGFALARALPDFKRRFVTEDRATEVAHEQAFQEFYGAGLHRTEGDTGVLLFVSLLERRVVVLADEGIDSRVDASFWEGVDEAVLDGIRRGSLRDGLVAGIRRVGALLEDGFPRAPDDRNEIPDRVIVRRE